VTDRQEADKRVNVCNIWGSVDASSDALDSYRVIHIRVSSSMDKNIRDTVLKCVTGGRMAVAVADEIILILGPDTDDKLRGITERSRIQGAQELD
jgi:hypothetical protein